LVQDDLLVKVSPLLQTAGEWKEFLLDGDGEKKIKGIRRHERPEDLSGGVAL
jgi:hypothetical protein